MTTRPMDHIVVEIAPGGDPLNPASWVWEAITDPWVQRPVSIESGRRDESSEVGPSKCTLLVKNDDGRFSPRNPLGPWFGRLGLNTPIRVRWGGRSEVAASAWVDGPTGSQSQDAPSVNAPESNGLLVALWATYHHGDGPSTYTVPGSMTAGSQTSSTHTTARIASQSVGPGATGVRTATIGVAAANVDQYVAASLVITGTAITPTIGQDLSRLALSDNDIDTTADIVSMAPVTRGQTLVAIQTFQTQSDAAEYDPVSPHPGDYWTPVHTGEERFLRARVWVRPVTRNEDTGALLARFGVPRGILAGGSPQENHLRVLVVDGLGHERFTGFVSEWPTRWLGLAENSRVPLVANGIMRRLGQSDTPVVSPLRADVLQLGRPFFSLGEQCYWPLEIDRASATAGCPPLVDYIYSAASLPDDGGSVTFGDGGPVGSAGQARFTPGRGLQSTLSGLGDNGFMIEGWFDINADDSTLAVIVHWGQGGTAPQEPGDLTIGITNDSATVTFMADDELLPQAAFLSVTFGPVGGPHHFAVKVDSTATFYLDGVSQGAASLPSPVSAPDHLRLGWLGTTDTGLSHLAITDNSGAAINTSFLPGRVTAGAGHRGETAVTRMRRVAREYGLFVATTGDPADSLAMGPQAVGAPLAVFADCEATDAGVLHEHAAGFAYRSGRERMNQPVKLPLDWGQLRAKPEPTDDDQRIRNVVIASTGDDVATVVDEASVAALGRYVENVTANPGVATDLANIASWRLNLGTVDEMRWPRLTLNLAQDDGLIPAWLALRLADRISVAHDFPQLAGVNIDLIVEGWTETITSHQWTVELNCSPASPWNVGVLDDVTLGRLDTSGSELAAPGLALPGVAGSYASTPDNAALDIIGDLDIRAEVTPDDWTPAGNQNMVAKYTTTGDQRSYRLAILPDGTIQLAWSPAGASGVSAASTVTPTIPGAGRLAVRATLDVDNGSSGNTVTFYTAPSIDGPWTQLGISVVQTGATSIFSSTAVLEAGSVTDGTLEPFAGIIHALEVRNGIDGTVVADPRFDKQATGTTGFTDSAGRVWTVQGAAAIFNGAGTVDTSLLVADVTGNSRWTTDPVAFPFDVVMGGEVMTVTGISGTASPQTFTVVRGVNGITKPHLGGASVQLAHPNRLAL